MRRDVAGLAKKEYDLVIVGGGIFGICAAWDATLRGLSVALIERGDFAHATSANCFKIVHGGIRYLQHADLYRVRESSRERNALLRVAPHLVRPLPIVVPTYGHGRQSKGFLVSGLFTYNLITFDRNSGIVDPHRRIPWGHILSRQECLDLFPGLARKGLTGAVIFYDGQMYCPARLALSYLKSAVKAGAYATNYVEATGFLETRGRVYGLTARDRLAGGDLEIRGKVVLNAAGPWAEQLLKIRMGLELKPALTYSRDAYLVVARRCSERYALAVQGRTKDPDAIVSRGRRHLFIVPWRDRTLIGVWHTVHRGEPDAYMLTEEEVQGFLDEINEAYPPIGLALNDVTMWNAGLVLFGQNELGAQDLSYGKRSVLIDHAETHGIDGLLTMVGVRYTTSRKVAEKAVNHVFRKLGQKPPEGRTSITQIYGGRIDHFDDYLASAIRQRPPAVSPETIGTLVHQHGTAYREVLKYVIEDLGQAETLPGSTVIRAEVVHAVRHEMAQKLGDVVFRRTDLGTGGHPGEAALRSCAGVMASELSRDNTRVHQEIEEVEAIFPRL